MIARANTMSGPAEPTVSVIIPTHERAGLCRQAVDSVLAGTCAVHCRERWVRDGREVSQRGQRHRRRGDIFADAVVKCIVGPSTVLIEREAFEDTGGFRGDLEVAEDYEFFLRFLVFEPIGYIDEKLIDKRDRMAPQLSHKYEQIEGFRLRALGDLLADCLEAHACGPGGAGVVSADGAGAAAGEMAGDGGGPAGDTTAGGGTVAQTVEAVDRCSAVHGGSDAAGGFGEVSAVNEARFGHDG